MTIAIPALEELQQDGEDGRKKIVEYTRYLTVALALLQSSAMAIGFGRQGLLIHFGIKSVVVAIVTMTAGSAFLMWIGERITENGVGNGISIVLLLNILASLPSDFNNLYVRFLKGQTVAKMVVAAAIIIAFIVAMVVFTIVLQDAERRIPVQYSKKVAGRRMVGAQNTHIPIKPALANVMPIIFASSFMTFPAMVIQLFVHNIENTTGFWRVIYNLSIATYSSTTVGWHYTIINAIIYLVLIVGFTYFYTYATFNPAEISSTIKQNGGFIPGIRAGKPTTEYLTNVLTKITLFGALFLAAIAIIPMLARGIGLNTAFGGTSILIVVGVAIELGDQLKSQLVMRHYKGFLEK